MEMLEIILFFYFLIDVYIVIFKLLAILIELWHCDGSETTHSRVGSHGEILITLIKPLLCYDVLLERVLFLLELIFGTFSTWRVVFFILSINNKLVKLIVRSLRIVLTSDDVPLLKILTIERWTNKSWPGWRCSERCFCVHMVIFLVHILTCC